MRILSPSRLVSAPCSGPDVPTWFRLVRCDDGILALESAPDANINRPDVVWSYVCEPPVWSYVCEPPPHIARQLGDDDSPDQVANVLNRALRALGFL